jgi:hypothetical protein
MAEKVNESQSDLVLINALHATSGIYQFCNVNRNAAIS